MVERWGERGREREERWWSDVEKEERERKRGEIWREG